VIELSKEQPYPGLRPFDSGDEKFFFGREVQAHGLWNKLTTSRLVAVVGRSGCGKSSLVKAGLVPLLGRETDADGQPVWHIASFRPQGQPITQLSNELWRLTKARSATKAATDPDQSVSLAGRGEEPSGHADSLSQTDAEQLHRSRLDAMLRRSSQGLAEAATELALPASQHLLIIVDQFEEIFRFEGARGNDADEATAFVRLLTEAIHSTVAIVRVILTMRLDFLGDCARFQRLPEAISDGQFLVPNLSRAERRAAIEEPAKKSGSTINPAVTQRLLNEIGEDPDRLPVLQHVLMRTWQQANGASEIKLEDYNATGGVDGAISRHAEEVYNRLDAEHQHIAERMFKAISELDRRARAIRRPVRLGEIAAIAGLPEEKNEQDKLIHVVDSFRAPECCFLMPSASEPIGDTTLIDISHESLLRGWIKMTGKNPGEGWLIEEDRDGKMYRSLLDDEKEGSTLAAKVARERQKWWNKANPNKAWAERYGDNFDNVKAFLENSARRALYRDAAILVLASLAGLGLFVAALTTTYWIAERTSREKIEDQFNKLTAQNENTLRERAAQNEKTLRERNDAAAEVVRQRAELDRRQTEFANNLAAAQRSLPQAPVSVRDNLDRLILQTQGNIEDAAQRVGADKRQGPSANLADDQSLVGSRQKGYLRPPDSSTAIPADMVEKKEYIVTSGIYLRTAPPDRPGYTQAKTTGDLNEGTRVQVVNVLEPYPRPTGDQFWAEVKVISVPLGTVYFQFAGGSRDQAQLISKALRDKGYTIPGEERTLAAAGKRVVRYFDSDDKDAALKLAGDAQRVLQSLGYASKQPIGIEQSKIGTTKNNPDGNLELWIEIPPDSGQKKL
jgi:energy-coupling factor transporter ATP-binding protein EcfA2